MSALGVFSPNPYRRHFARLRLKIVVCFALCGACIGVALAAVAR